jgi:hypothetical protein
VNIFQQQAQLPLTEELIIDRIKTADWKYEFSDDERRMRKGHQAMERLEGMVFEYWKENPDKAVELWNTYSPAKAPKKDIVPSFIFRMQYS